VVARTHLGTSDQAANRRDQPQRRQIPATTDIGMSNCQQPEARKQF
jgi:hypothetical protein